jgi:hypothetical protein
VIQPDDRNERIEPIRWPAPVIRVSLRWDGSTWRIEREHRVDSMTLPAPDQLPAGENSRGFWVETIDRQGRVRHREVMADPLAGMEQFDEGGDVSRMLHRLPDIEIDVLVPDLPDLAEIHLVSNPPAPHHGQDKERPQRTRIEIKGRPAKDDRDDSRPDRDDHGGGHGGHHGHDHDHPQRTEPSDTGSNPPPTGKNPRRRS